SSTFAAIASASRRANSAPTCGCTIWLSRARASSSAKAIAPSALRSSEPSAVRIPGPNASASSATIGMPGAWSSWTIASASITVAPSSRSMRATVLLPEPIPPVTPITTLTPASLGRARVLRHIVFVHDHAVLAVGLRAVERLVGLLEEALAVSVERGDADRHGDAQRAQRVVDDERRLGDRSAHLLGEQIGARRIGAGCEDHELLAAVARAQVAAAHGAVQDLRDPHEDLVACSVAEPVVQPLEVVDVDHQDR